MKNLKIVLALVILSCAVKAQDSTKTITQEIGFNTVSMIKQLISNNPSNTLEQSPYLIFYNIYFKDKIGVRVGLGLFNSRTENSIEGQAEPRTTTSSDFNLRTGISYNFVRQSRLTLNVFADNLLQRSSSETINTSTLQVFPNPIEKITTVTTDKLAGIGAQVGVGVKYNIYKHLSIYAEVPLSLMATTITSNVTISELGQPDDTQKSTVKSSQTKITLPTTLYLVLRF